MKYFTPELYLKFSARDRRTVAKAHEQWERAISAYQEHLAEIAPRMTPGIRKLATTLCLHDAEYLGISLPQMAGSAGPLAVVPVRQRESVLFLVYLLTREPLIQEVTQKWPYSKDNVHWLYDEFDVCENGDQEHEILLSNGRLISLRFQDLQIMTHRADRETAAA